MISQIKKDIKNPEIKEEENNNLKNFIIHFIYSSFKLSNEEKIEDYDATNHFIIPLKICFKPILFSFDN